MAMQPYVIKQGDYLAKLAFRFGFDPDAVWGDEKNSQLRQLRPDPNLLFPGEILYIPDQVNKTPAMTTLTTGTTNNFVSEPPAASITLRFLDARFASQAYSVQELPTLTDLTTGGDGTATFSIPVTLEVFTVEFTESGTTFDFKIGHLDPIDTLSGIFQRLQNLGYIDLSASATPSPDMDLIRDALRAFKASEGVPSEASPASSDGDPSPSSDPSPISSAPASGSSPAPSPSGPVSESDSVPPSSDSGSSADATDNAGLNDDGTLDDATSKLLLSAHLS